MTPRRHPTARRRRACAVAICLLAATAAGRAGGVVEPHVGAAAIIGIGMRDLKFRLALRGGMHRWWTPADRLDVGIHVGAALTRIPYGNNDGEVVIGERGGYNPSYLDNAVTLMPGMAFAARLLVSDYLSLLGRLGVTMLWSDPMGPWFFVPFPTASIGAQLWAAGHLALQVEVEYMALDFDLGPARAVWGPAVSIVWR